MTIYKRPFFVRVVGLLALGLAFGPHRLPAQEAAVGAIPFAITAISVEDTNLVLNAVVPAGVDQVALESRVALAGRWTEAAILAVPAAGGEVIFTIPKPSARTAFFRLRATQTVTQTPLVSTELHYVTMPCLAANTDAKGDAIFHFKGVVDGSDRIAITRAGALWEHVNWDWPQGTVNINGTRWNPREKNYLTTAGAARFLPETFSLESADLETLHGRDTVGLERTGNAVIVYLDDTPPGADAYEFKLHFHPLGGKPPAPVSSARARLKIAAQIDGSDCLKITATEASWQHKMYSWPGGISLNGIPWNPRAEGVRKNEGTNQFLPPGIDFSTARIVGRQGRDVATMWSDHKAIWVVFADNPNGAEAYELEIAFGH
jgi:hypothetical protein